MALDISNLADCASCRSLSRVHPKHEHPTRTIINADDLGLSESIDSSIFRFAEAGAITSASLIAVGKDFERAASWARRQDKISVGVHLCLSDRLKPLTEAHQLVDKYGSFHRLGRVAVKTFCRRIALDEILLEWRAQIALIRSRGIEPTHLDSHQHVHILPGIADIMIELAREEGLAVRHTAGPFSFNFASCKYCSGYWGTLCRPGLWKSMLVRCLGRRLKLKLNSLGMPTPDAYISPSSLCGRMRCEVTEESVWKISRLAVMTGGIVEWVVHPSSSDEHSRDQIWMRKMRSSENRLLEKNAHMNALHANNAIAITYSGPKDMYGRQSPALDM